MPVYTAYEDNKNNKTLTFKLQYKVNENQIVTRIESFLSISEFIEI